MGNPIPAIIEAVEEQLSGWAPDSGVDFADLLDSLSVLFSALHSGLEKAIKSADPGESLNSDVHGDLEAVLSHLSRVQELAEEASEDFEKAYAFWLGRD